MSALLARLGVITGRAADRKQPEPQIEQATTRALLAEIAARGAAEDYYLSLGVDMACGAAELADRLPGSMLDYRRQSLG